MSAGDLGLPHKSIGFPNIPDSTGGMRRPGDVMTLLSFTASGKKYN
jgi:hypothetical protein